jgi:dCTP diphosphatase
LSGTPTPFFEARKRGGTAVDRLEEVVRELRAFVAEREWEQFHDPKNLAMAVASEAGELLAEYRWVNNAEADSYSRREEPRQRIASEAADVGIALVLFCDRIGLDLIDAIKEKVIQNRRNYPVELSRGRWERPS